MLVDEDVEEEVEEEVDDEENEEREELNRVSLNICKPLCVYWYSRGDCYSRSLPPRLLNHSLILASASS